MRSVLSFCAWALGFRKGDQESSDLSETSDWGDENPERTLLREQLEYYLSDTNLENDNHFKTEIAKNVDRWVSVEYIMHCNRVKQLGATVEDVLQAASSSPYLEANFAKQAVRSKTPFVSDARRPFRSLRVSGFAKDVPQWAQLQFFQTILPGIVRITLLRKANENGVLESLGITDVELEDEEVAKAAVKRGIEYGKGLLNVQLLSDFHEKQTAKTGKKAEARQPRQSSK
jgi:hypothetical protein